MDQHDIKQGYYVTKPLADYYTKTGEQALWSTNMFSGMPAYLDRLIFSGDLLQYVQNILHMGIPRPAQIIFLTCLSFYIMLLAFKVRPWIAFIGAIIFGFNGFSIIGIVAGHNAKIQALAYLPLVIAGVKLAFDKKYLLGASLFALALGLNLHANHLQITYYLAFIILIWGAVELIYAIKSKELNHFIVVVAFLCGGAIMAIGANIGKLWTVLEYSQYSTRGKNELTLSDTRESGLDLDYAFQYSNGIYEPLVMFIPNILGGSSANALNKDSNVGEALKRAGYAGNQLTQTLQSIPTYWGDQPLTAPYYLGSLLIFLLILGFKYSSKKEKLWLIPILILGIIFSWGSNFNSLNELIFNYFPGYNKFRSVTFAIVLPMFVITFLAAIGLERFVSDSSKNKLKNLYIAILGSIGFGVFLFIISSFLKYNGAVDSRIGADWFVSALKADRKDLLRGDIWRLIILCAIFGSLLWLSLKGKISNLILIGGLCVIVLFDVLGLSKRFLKDGVFVKTSISMNEPASEADIFIQRDSKPGQRVLNLQNPFNEARTAFFHESIGGYHGAKMHRYQDFIEHQISKDHSNLINGLQNSNSRFEALKSLNILNTVYFKAGETRNAVIKNPAALGQAWLVNKIEMVATANEEILTFDKIDPKTTAVVNTSQFDLGIKEYSGSGSLSLLSKTPNELIYQADIKGGSSFGVFSEIYYPKGWKASINGELVEILRADYILRAIELPEGSYEIKFSFKPRAYYIGAKLTWIFNLLILFLFLGALGLEIKRTVQS